ncbi:SH3 domain protein [Desulfobotulus alkaliphilus]|uniref:SH3 domain protein n=1 Tax=Desulfobotulus alkaliphilus TaxID=622671 RepID=A0A562RRN9_9BACT|nr:TIGR04211 family SH3 domain-containing protein [Desulfobotulus alkaliphilus]TWI71765.1 SH3 domain protein [Desulfobotulus alkaliphilus]
MRYFIFFFTLLLMAPCTPRLLLADQAYVTDSLEISIRRGPTTAHRILRFIESGHPVKVLEENDGWSLVQTLDSASTNGWVLSRYLTRKLPLKKQVLRLEEENRDLTERFTSTYAAWEKAEQEGIDLKEALSQTQTLLDETREKLDQLTKDSAGYLYLKEKAETLEKERDTLLHENIVLRTQTRNQTLLIGGGLVFAGLFLGFVWGRRQRRYASGRLL